MRALAVAVVFPESAMLAVVLGTKVMAVKLLLANGRVGNSRTPVLAAAAAAAAAAAGVEPTVQPASQPAAAAAAVVETAVPGPRTSALERFSILSHFRASPPTHRSLGPNTKRQI
jgi:hypothetical protein